MFTNISKESGDAALITGSGPAKIISFGVPHKLYVEMAMSYMQNSSLFSVMSSTSMMIYMSYFTNECNHGKIKHRTWLDKSEYIKFSTLGLGIEWELWGPGISWAREKWSYLSVAFLTEFIFTSSFCHSLLTIVYSPASRVQKLLELWQKERLTLSTAIFYFVVLKLNNSVSF